VQEEEKEDRAEESFVKQINREISETKTASAYSP
jgi:hypothetical protein